MLLVDVDLRPSPKHGLGVFARTPIPRGAMVWQLDLQLDLALDDAALAELPERARDFVRHFGFWEGRLEKQVLCGDHARFMNHDDDPNTDGCRAVRDIAAGEELTCAYNRRDLEFRGPRRLPPEAVPRMILLLAEPDRHLRRYAAKSLSTAGAAAEPAAESLADALSDPDDLTRYFAAKALSRLERVPADAEAALERLARASGAPERLYALKACGRLRHPREQTRELLRAALEDPDRELREVAERALEQLATADSARE